MGDEREVLACVVSLVIKSGSHAKEDPQVFIDDKMYEDKRKDKDAE